MTLLSNEMLRNSTEDLSTTEMRGRQPRPLIINMSYLLGIAMRVSQSKLRRRKLEQFDYEAYRAVFAKRYISTNVVR